MKRCIFLLLFTYAGVSMPMETGISCPLERWERFTEARKNLRIESLLHTFRIIESSNRYDAVGGSGEFGAYQFMPGTWAMYSLRFFGEILDITVPENQDKVARKKVETLVEAGYSDAQIAAFWNSGRTSGWEDIAGINSFGVRFDVAMYVERFLNIKNQI